MCSNNRKMRTKMSPIPIPDVYILPKPFGVRKTNIQIDKDTVSFQGQGNILLVSTHFEKETHNL